MKEMMGAFLVRKRLISESQLNTALAHQKRMGGRLGTNLLSLRFVTKKKLLDALSEYFNRPAVDLEGFVARADLVKMIPTSLAREAGALPVREDRDASGAKRLFCAMLQPDNLAAIDKLMFAVDHVVKPMVALDPPLRELLDYHYHDPLDASFGSFDGRSALEIAKATSPDSLDHLFTLPDPAFSDGEYRPAGYSFGDDDYEIEFSDRVDAKHYLKYLIRLLVKKGVLTKEDVQDVFRKID